MVPDAPVLGYRYTLHGHKLRLCMRWEAHFPGAARRGTLALVQCQGGVTGGITGANELPKLRF